MSSLPRTQYVCPFCGSVIADVYLDVQLWYGALIESSIRGHLTNKHPIRSRLNRKVRKALRDSVLAANEQGGTSMNSYDRPVPEPPNG